MFTRHSTKKAILAGLPSQVNPTIYLECIAIQFFKT